MGIFAYLNLKAVIPRSFKVYITVSDSEGMFLVNLARYRYLTYALGIFVSKSLFGELAERSNSLGSILGNVDVHIIVGEKGHIKLYALDGCGRNRV